MVEQSVLSAACLGSAGRGRQAVVRLNSSSGGSPLRRKFLSFSAESIMATQRSKRSFFSEPDRGFLRDREAGLPDGDRSVSRRAELFCTVRNFLLRAASAWLRVAFMAIWAIGILAAQAVAAVPCLSGETVSLIVSAPGPIAPYDSETVKWDFHGGNVKCDVSLLRLYYRDKTTGILRLVVEQHFPV